MGVPSVFVAVYILAALHPLILVLVSGHSHGTDVLYEIGRNLALVSFPIICVQPLLTARVPWIDGPVGMGNTLRFHKAMGIAALVGLLSHPVCLAFGGAGINLLASLNWPWYVIAGKITLVIFTVHVGLALFRAQMGMPYPTWKRVHAVTAPLILAGALLHSWYTGGDLGLRALQVYWIVLLAVAATALVYRRLHSR